MNDPPAKTEVVAGANTTRSSTKVWLIGHPIPILDMVNYNQLPTVGQVLRRLFFDLKTNKLTLPASCSNVIDEVLQLWQAANIPTTQKPNAVSKLKLFYQKHIKVGKNKARRTERQTELESEFCNQLTKLFDVAHADCYDLIRIPEDLKFLQDQQGARKMVMAGEDKMFKQREENRWKRKHEESRRQEKAKQMAESSIGASTSYTAIIDEEMETTTSDDSADEPDISKYHRHQQLATSSALKLSPKPPMLSKRRVIDDPLFVASLDRTKTTMRQAMHIVAPALMAAGVDVDDLTLSTTSLYESRKVVRKSLGESVREKFSPNIPLIAHFDGKLLPDNDGVISDRMPVVVSGMNTEKLLGIPKIPSGTGLAMGNAIVQLLQEWDGVPECLAGLCFDTTSANTGIHTGAITIIQNAFAKRLLFLACRHHILEIIAAAVFDLFFVLSGPQIAIFGRFKDYWPFIDVNNYAPIDKDTAGCSLTADEKEWLEQNRKDVVDFLHSQLKNKIQPRQDYLQFIKLSLITLGETKPAILGKVVFGTPGAHHHARWMAKGIYCLKIFCFREQFQLTEHELQALKRICLFTVTIYVKAWFCAPSSCNAPYNDLCLLQRMELFKMVDSQVAQMASAKLRGQLWYLSEDLIGLALFSDHVCAAEKMAIVEALQREEMKNDLRRMDSNTIKTFQSKTLSDFAMKRSLNLFYALNINCDFLDTNSRTWVNQEDYIQAKEKISALRVVNDCAERAVKLASDYNLVLTNDEEQHQLLFQVVEHHRQLMGLPHKKNFKKK